MSKGGKQHLRRQHCWFTNHLATALTQKIGYLIAWNIQALCTYLGNDMTALELAQKRLLLTEHAIFNVKFAAAEERKLTHAKHIDKYYVEALDRLEVKLCGDRAYLSRVEILEE